MNLRGEEISQAGLWRKLCPRPYQALHSIGDQPEGCEGARPHDPAVTAAARGRGDSMIAANQPPRTLQALLRERVSRADFASFAFSPPRPAALCGRRARRAGRRGAATLPRHGPSTEFPDYGMRVGDRAQESWEHWYRVVLILDARRFRWAPAAVDRLCLDPVRALAGFAAIRVAGADSHRPLTTAPQLVRKCRLRRMAVEQSYIPQWERDHRERGCPPCY